MGMFIVSAPSFMAENLAGESRYDFVEKPDGADVTVRCVTGKMGIKGRHFAIAEMSAADEFRIRSDRDNLETILYGNSGDYIVKLDGGIVAKTEFDENGTIKQEEQKSELEWHLSPSTSIRINRAVPSIGERMSVHIMAFDAAGQLAGEGKTFCEGRASINFGEIEKKEAVSAEELAKKAAEATSEEKAKEDEGGETTEETTEEKAEENAAE